MEIMVSLGLLHVLLLMDDAVIMATSREMCLKKLEVVYEFCCESGMKINEKKTKFFVVNGEECDRQCLTSGGVSNCELHGPILVPGGMVHGICHYGLCNDTA